MLTQALCGAQFSNAHFGAYRHAYGGKGYEYHGRENILIRTGTGALLEYGSNAAHTGTASENPIS